MNADWFWQYACLSTLYILLTALLNKQFVWNRFLKRVFQNDRSVCSERACRASEDEQVEFERRGKRQDPGGIT